MSNMQKVEGLLAKANDVTIDGVHVECWELLGEPAVRFVILDGDDDDTCDLSEAHIEAGFFDERGTFSCRNQEDRFVKIKFFNKTQLSVAA